MMFLRPANIYRLLLIALTLLAAAPPAAAGPVVARADGVYSKETRHSLTEPFWGYWVEHDGPSFLGLPITEPLLSGKDEVQYFEFGALVSRNGRVERLKAGAVLRNMLAKQSNVVAPEIGSIPIAPTSKPSKEIDKQIKTYVAKHGGRGRFGKALGKPAVSGEFVVQWYDYGQIKVENDANPIAHQTKIGQDLARARNVSMDKVNRNGLPTLDPNRPGANYFVGDGAVPEAAGAFAPAQITIPSLGMNAAIEQIGIVDGVMGVPVDAWKVGWYHQLSSPGLTGNTIMAGHVDWWGIGPTIFANLASIQLGAMIYLVDPNGAGATYTVSSVESVAADTNAITVIAPTEVPSLTLITCTGSFTGVEYTSLLIVKAIRI
jgi:hypothetical protein